MSSNRKRLNPESRYTRGKLFSEPFYSRVHLHVLHRNTTQRSLKAIRLFLSCLVCSLFAANQAPGIEDANLEAEGQQGQVAQEILFVDYRVSDKEMLVAELRGNTKVVVLDADSPGIDQIAVALQGTPDITAIHVLSHGAPGSAPAV